MAALRCWRCLPPTSPLQCLAHSLTRPTAVTSFLVSPPATPVRSFSGTSSLTRVFDQTAPKKGVHRRAGKHSQISKKSKFRPSWGPKIEPGQRKMFRKRIVLSNNNALPVDLDEVGRDTFSSPDCIGQMVAFPDADLEMLRTAEAFKPTQSWGLFRRSATLVRRETVELCQKMANATTGKKQLLRCIISGEKVSGKSTLLLQALTWAKQNGWVVLNIPEAQDIISSSSSYCQIGDTERWEQPRRMHRLLQQLYVNNKSLIHGLSLSKVNPHAQNLTGNIGSQLSNCAEAEGIYNVWRAVFWELTQVPNRPPLLICLDGLTHAMQNSQYRAKDFSIIHAHNLEIIATFCDLMSGKRTAVNGGAVLGAINASNCPRNHSVEFAIRYKESLQQLSSGNSGKNLSPPTDLQVQLPMRDPFCRDYDPRVDEVLDTTDLIKVGGVDRLEARAIMEYWAASGLYRHTVDEARVAEAWTTAGAGILGEMERATLRNPMCCARTTGEEPMERGRVKWKA